MRKTDPYSGKAFGLSLLLHLGLLAFLWLSTLHRPPVMEFVTYQIELVSPPPAVQAEESVAPTQELVVERPEETPPEPEPEPPTPAPQPERRRPEPEPEPPPRRETPRETPPEAAPETTTPAAPTTPPEEPPEEAGEGINVRLEGLRRDYPAYYENIIRQIQRCFRWQGTGRWETTVSFAIQRDGGVGDIEFVARSGNTQFDFEAMGAVDCAGQGRFGPLPDDLPYDRLPVQFTFRPNGGS